MADHDPTDPLESAQAPRPQSPRSTTSSNFPPSPRSHQRRRSSFAELFASRPSIDTGSTTRQQLQAAQQAQQQQPPPGAPQEGGRGMSTVFGDPARTRRLSITTLGLSGSPSHSGQGMQTSPFGSLRSRGKSMSTGFAGDSSTAETSQESAIDESDEVPPMKNSPPQGRRVSFGARAYGTAAQRSGSIAGLTGVQQGVSGSSGSGSNGEKDPSPTSAKAGSSPPGLRKSGEGYNWAENFRNRAERASISAASGMGIGAMTGMPGGSHARTKSQAQSEPAATAPKPPPQKPPPPKGPDQFQERILKGDFYMD